MLPSTHAGTVLNVNGVAGNDAVNITDPNLGTVQRIRGIVNVSNPQGLTDLMISNNGDVVPRTFTLDTLPAPGVLYGSLQGLAPAPINFAGPALHSLIVMASGITTNSVTVNNTPAAVQLPSSISAMQQYWGWRRVRILSCTPVKYRQTGSSRLTSRRAGSRRQHHRSRLFQTGCHWLIGD